MQLATNEVIYVGDSDVDILTAKMLISDDYRYMGI